jgi:hypothetical protein
MKNSKSSKPASQDLQRRKRREAHEKEIENVKAWKNPYGFIVDTMRSLVISTINIHTSQFLRSYNPSL